MTLPNIWPEFECANLKSNPKFKSKQKISNYPTKWGLPRHSTGVIERAWLLELGWLKNESWLSCSTLIMSLLVDFQIFKLQFLCLHNENNNTNLRVLFWRLNGTMYGNCCDRNKCPQLWRIPALPLWHWEISQMFCLNSPSTIRT